MLKRLSFLFSMSFMGVLMVLLIVILALATFVESAFDTSTAWAVAYGTHWFELLLLLIGINIVGVMIRKKFYSRKKIVVFLFHVAFILILAGAAITRFISFEGVMHIRENNAANSMMSRMGRVDVQLDLNGERVEHGKEVRLSELTPRDYRARMRIGGEHVRIRSVGYMASAMEKYVASPVGDPFLQIMIVADRQVSVGMPSGTTRNAMGMDISFNSEDSLAALRFVSEGEQIHAFATFTISTSQMGGEEEITYQPGEAVPIKEGALYKMGQMRMALQLFLPSATRQLVRAPAGQAGSHLAAVRLEVNYKGMKSEIYVPGLPRLTGTPVKGTMGDLNYTISYGSREIVLPFSLYLKDFQLDRYPGSNSPSSFASEVTLIDEEMGIREERRIFMNNVLKHRGFRFYQSSYDTDEMGTVLSVNKDLAGTLVTYIGYAILIAGMILAMFVRRTRFAMLARKSAGSLKAALIVLLLLGAGIQARSQEVPPEETAREFGELWVQDKGGRFEPMNTLSNEVVRKITKKARFENYTADQVLLGMILYPSVWQQMPLFKVKQPELQRILGYKGEMVSFNDLMSSDGNAYLLSEVVNEAYSKEVAARNDLDKEVIKLDDRVNAMFLVQSGGLIRIFPDPGAENSKWASVSEALMGQMEAREDTMGNVFLRYLQALQHGNYMEARGQLVLMRQNQLKEELLPSEGKKKLEVFYNRINIFPRLAKFYGIFGLLLIVLQFMIVFKPRKRLKLLFTIGVIHVASAFALHTLTLAVRWYISGHAPMSNGYESMIFVSWVTILAGLIFVRRSGYAMALTSILAALALMVAGMSNMNPEITNLVPVLKSPWLTIHVTVIMAGYGFLGLASIMGLLNVVVYALLTPKNKDTMQNVIEQVTLVNHLTLIVGLYFMTAGTFLGGVWANESWGRYWGWDPKETWALITVLVYAFVTHMHRIPGLRGYFAFNLASFISYASVMMTYFGVNYFLGGIHSYASGSSFKLPWFTYVIVILVVVLAVFSYLRQSRILPDHPEQEE